MIFNDGVAMNRVLMNTTNTDSVSSEQCWEYKGEFSCRALTHSILEIMSQSCSHVVNHKLPSNHILGVHQNLEGHRHEPLDFHAPHQRISNLQVPINEDFEDRFQKEEEAPTWRRRGQSLGLDLRRQEQLVGTCKLDSPLDSLYVWPCLSLFPLEDSGRVAQYMETHHHSTQMSKCQRECMNSKQIFLLNFAQGPMEYDWLISRSQNQSMWLNVVSSHLTFSSSNLKCQLSKQNFAT